MTTQDKPAVGPLSAGDVTALTPWMAHNPRYGVNFRPVAAYAWVQVKGGKDEPDGPPRRAFDVYWGDRDDCDNPVRWYREVRLAPTAPVEANGSERETVFDGEAHDLVQTAQALAIAIERVPDWLMNDNLLTAHCHAEVLIADLPAALRPQPSGETRHAVARIRERISAWDGEPARKVQVGVPVSDLRAILALGVAADQAKGGEG